MHYVVNRRKEISGWRLWDLCVEVDVIVDRSVAGVMDGLWDLGWTAIPFTLWEVPLPPTVSSSRSVLSQAIVVNIGSADWPSDRNSFWRHKAVSISLIWEYYSLWPSQWQYMHQLHVFSECLGGTVVCFVGFTLLYPGKKDLQSHWAYQTGLSGLLYLSGVYRNVINDIL
jgi:hypothetical protein